MDFLPSESSPTTTSCAKLAFITRLNREKITQRWGNLLLSIFFFFIINRLMLLMCQKLIQIARDA